MRTLKNLMIITPETRSRCSREWKEIDTLRVKEDRTQEEEDTLLMLKHKFTAVLSVDYQMQKPVPQWGIHLSQVQHICRKCHTIFLGLSIILTTTQPSTFLTKLLVQRIPTLPSPY